jgi:uncharacterized protein involved in exopolysaccharide biosynthesis
VLLLLQRFGRLTIDGSEPVMNSQSDFERILQAIISHRIAILVTSSGFALLAAAILFFVPDTYRSEALLAVNTDSSNQALAGGLAQSGSGLAGLAGIALGGIGDDRSTLGLEVLKSRKFIGDFINSRGILPSLFAATGWDQESDTLKIDSSVYDVDKSIWVRKANPPRQSMPSVLEAYEEFAKRLDVSQSKETGFVKVSFEFYSPILAQKWLDWLIADLNKEMRERDIQRAEKAIVFLEDQIAATSLAELRQVFFNLIEEQTKSKMLASISDEYLFMIIDPPLVADERYKPTRLLLVLVIFSAALIGGAAIIAVRIVYWNSNRGV